MAAWWDRFGLRGGRVLSVSEDEVKEKTAGAAALKAHEEEGGISISNAPSCVCEHAAVVGGATIHWWGLGLAASASLVDANTGPLTPLTSFSDSFSLSFPGF